MATLTPRERQVVDALARTRGTDKIVARELGISYNTVKMHMRHIAIKLGTTAREQIAGK